MNLLKKYCISDFWMVAERNFSIDADGHGEAEFNGLVGGALVLRGMTLPETRVFVGDFIGHVTVLYENGRSDIYDLIVGEGLFWGSRFGTYPEPLMGNPACYALLCDAMKLLPKAPINDEEGYCLCLRTEKTPVKAVYYDGRSDCIPSIPSVYLIADPGEFFAENILEKAGVNAALRAAKIKRLREVLYVNGDNFPASFETESTGDTVHSRFVFGGNQYAQFFTNVLNFNLADMFGKIEDGGYAHTSSLHAPWYGYDAIGGTYTKDGRIYPWQEGGMYYRETWTRDLGRILLESIRFGRDEKVKNCLAWVLESIRHWEDGDAPTLEGVRLPRHVQRILQRFETELGHGCFENDGHAMCSLALWLYWKRSGDVDFLRTYRTDIMALGNWYLWQFANPAVSRAMDVLWSDSESSGWPFKTGLSFYVDYLSAEALEGLAEIAESYGDGEAIEAAGNWRNLARRMNQTAEKYYLGDWKGNKCWCRNESWDPQTSLSHIITSPDRGSLCIGENQPEWKEYDRFAGARNREMAPDGGAMGYNVAFSLQAALLLDCIDTATAMLQSAARMIYNPVTSPFLVPESGIPVGNGAYTRMGDLGNGVQQAEILKCLRIIVGIDDLHAPLTFIPRLPDGWQKIEAHDFKAYDDTQSYTLQYHYSRSETEAVLFVSADRDMPACRVRLGGFAENAAVGEVSVNGTPVADYTVEDAGGRRWIWVSLAKRSTNRLRVKATVSDVCIGRMGTNTEKRKER